MHIQTPINTYTHIDHHPPSQPSKAPPTLGIRNTREAAQLLIWAPDALEARQQTHQEAMGKPLGPNPRKMGTLPRLRWSLGAWSSSLLLLEFIFSHQE